MPKMKTNKSAAKRFRRTASGKLKFTKASRGHLLSSKTRKRKRNLRKGGMVNKVDQKRIESII